MAAAVGKSTVSGNGEAGSSATAPLSKKAKARARKKAAAARAAKEKAAEGGLDGGEGGGKEGAEPPPNRRVYIISVVVLTGKRSGLVVGTERAKEPPNGEALLRSLWNAMAYPLPSVRACHRVIVCVCLRGLRGMLAWLFHVRLLRPQRERYHSHGFPPSPARNYLEGSSVFAPRVQFRWGTFCFFPSHVYLLTSFACFHYLFFALLLPPFLYLCSRSAPRAGRPACSLRIERFSTLRP